MVLALLLAETNFLKFEWQIIVSEDDVSKFPALIMRKNVHYFRARQTRCFSNFRFKEYARSKKKIPG